MPRFLAPLRNAYASGDLARLVAEYARVRRHPLLALPLRALESIYPVWEFLQIAPTFDRRIAERGLVEASQWLLDTYVSPWRCEMAAQIRSTISAGPVLVYGNHAALTTPFLVAAAMARPDLRILSADYVRNLLPSYSSYAFPVEIPHGRWREEYRRGGLRGAVQAKLLGLMPGTQRTERTRQRNRASLQAGADHLARGGCVLVCPEGGSIRQKLWYTGIGYIAHSAVSRAQGLPVQCLPYLEQHMSHRRACASVQRGPWARFRRRFLSRHPVTIRFADPVALHEIVRADDTPVEITGRLQTHYRGLFPG